MSWYIDASINEGYPTNTDFIPAHVGWTDTDTIPLPELAWRIRADANEGYPFIGYFFTSHSGQQGGEMSIGGSQTNYPNGFTIPQNGIPSAMTAGSMKDGIIGSASHAIQSSVIGATMSDRAFALTNVQATYFASYFRSQDFFDAITQASFATVVQTLFGANIYDSVISMRAWPFEIEAGDTFGEGDVKLFGVIPIMSGGANMQASRLIVATHIYDLGTLPLARFYNKGWQFENITWYLYLPYAGTFALDLRSNSDITVLLAVDYYSGMGEYQILQDGNVFACYKANLAIDVPIHRSNAQAMTNLISTVAPTILSGAALATSAISKAGGNAIGETGIAKDSDKAVAVGASIQQGGKVASNKIKSISDAIKDTTQTSHFTISSPSIGGACGSYCYPYPRLIAKVPVMHNNAEGYAEVIGENKSRLAQVGDQAGGFIICENYKCDIIVATDDEKAEIERLMNAGVFV